MTLPLTGGQRDLGHSMRLNANKCQSHGWNSAPCEPPGWAAFALCLEMALKLGFHVAGGVCTMLGPQGPTFIVLFYKCHIPLLFKISISGLGGGWETLAHGDNYICHCTHSFLFDRSHKGLLVRHLIFIQ